MHLGKEYYFKVVDANGHPGTPQIFSLVKIPPSGTVKIVSYMVYALSSNAYDTGAWHSISFHVYNREKHFQRWK